MGQPYVGEIRMFAGNFAPAGWMFCSGQLLPISENDVLFQLIGTTYGGDGQETFGLPDLQGRVPVHMGQGPGLGTYQIGEKVGVENVTLTTNQMPIHSHPLLASSDAGNSPNPGGNVLAKSVTQNVFLYLEDTTAVNLASSAMTPNGGSQPHDNMQPYLCISFIISLFGIFPSPN
jgi:microcystin-dependent protein